MVNMKPKTLPRGQIDREKYKCLCGLQRGFSVSANPEYLKPGQRKALAELADEGICFLDKSGINEPPAKGKKAGQNEIDPGDALGRYRMVAGQHQAAKQLADQLERGSHVNPQKALDRS